ncbi:two-component hybrid sensor and regulator [Salipiger mucosus DSM 16094]|uniref:histidine kinase n=1 Tax=Salipiger mucosus DSM 16094 TaxID=1123237 RepID=S9SL38_9RHOB|nr:two-component hybrid sensor and regulator [Salipiger mucosus DSM 16094]
MVLSADAARHIQALATANSDSSQWALAQVEVEFAALQEALNAPPERVEPAEIRRAFDVFYSRTQTIATGAPYAGVVAEERAGAAMGRLQDFLRDVVPLIDGPDTALIDALPRLQVRATNLRSDVRRLSLDGVRVFSTEAEARRRAVMQGLVRLAATTAALVMALAVGVVALWRLVREAREQARRRARANHRLEAVVATALDAIVVTTRNWRILEFNAAARAIFGLSREAALGQHAGDLLFPPECRAVACRDSDGGRLRTTARRADGTSFPAEVAVTRSEQRGNVLRVISLRDITRQVSDEAELVAARDQAVAGEHAKARLLAVMSHEMRTPLNGMIGALELMDDTQLSADQREYLRVLRRSGDILLGHVNDVLDISRLETGEFTFARAPFVPHALLEEVADTLQTAARARGTRLCLATTDDGPPVLGDHRRLRQVLLNLVGNAVKFTENGEVRISLRRDSARERIAIAVADTGIGISPEQLECIFEDFVTLDASYMRTAEGTGLGLGIARRLVEGMGGTTLGRERARGGVDLHGHGAGPCGRTHHRCAAGRGEGAASGAGSGARGAADRGQSRQSHDRDGHAAASRACRDRGL